METQPLGVPQSGVFYSEDLRYVQMRTTCHGGLGDDWNSECILLPENLLQNMH